MAEFPWQLKAYYRSQKYSHRILNYFTLKDLVFHWLSCDAVNFAFMFPLFLSLKKIKFEHKILHNAWLNILFFNLFFRVMALSLTVLLYNIIHLSFEHQIDESMSHVIMKKWNSKSEEPKASSTGMYSLFDAFFITCFCPSLANLVIFRYAVDRHTPFLT